MNSIYDLLRILSFCFNLIVIHYSQYNYYFYFAEDDNDYFNRSAEILEIDERLNRLQEFMKNNLT